MSSGESIPYPEHSLSQRRDMKKILIALIAILLLAVLLAACGSPSTSGFPTGKFVRSDNKAHGLTFNKDGTFSVFDGNATLVRGKYSTKSDTYTDESNDQNCPRTSFKYKFDGTNLTFNYAGKPTDDPCDGRRGDFNNVTYILSQ
jgi:hypothetical protein